MSGCAQWCSKDTFLKELLESSDLIKETRADGGGEERGSREKPLRRQGSHGLRGDCLVNICLDQPRLANCWKD